MIGHEPRLPLVSTGWPSGILVMQSQWGRASVNCEFTTVPFHDRQGYRIYFQKRGNTIIVLLCGGNKSTQQKDIETAKRLAREWTPESKEEHG